MDTTCKYCNLPEDKQEKPGLVCEECMCFVHLTCLQRPGTPGDFACDVFFDYTCEDCTPHNKEVFVRKRFPWVNVLVLTLYHLTCYSYGISNHGFFHYKTHICSFIDRNWVVLFGTQFKQKKNWVGTIAGALSVYNQLFFRSGLNALGESGWWKLLHNFSPAVAAHIIHTITQEKYNKGRFRNQLALDKTFLTRAAQLGYQDLICNDPDIRITGTEPGAKKRRLDSDELSAVSSTSFYDTLDDGQDVASEEVCLFSETAAVRSAMDVNNENQLRGFEYTPAAVSTRVSQSDSSSVHSMQQTHNFYDSESRSASPIHTGQTEDVKPEKIKKTTEEKAIVRRENLFSAQLNSVDLPWMEKVPEPDKNLIEMTEYEEVHLLKQIEALIPKVKDQIRKAELHRLRAKLALRRLKRHRRMPIFDLDKTVKILGGYNQDDTQAAVNIERVLDRFQRSYLIDNLSGTIANTNYGTVLLSTTEPTTLRSAYSGTILKPFIRRDYKATSTWLNLMDELLVRTHRHDPNYKPPARAALEYSYVRPHHVAAVNTLCAQFFWPGIDLTETLEYPEFSCVVTYKKLVVGCAFLVPDVSPHEAYISFVLTRPEWRRAKIATFMLYHLLQTCAGKDVTIHVSPTNPAIFLYQKFGFKVEELIQDFYEKYYDIDYKGCRHALFLRLVR